MAEATVESLRRGYEAFARGDIETAFEWADPGIVMHERLDLPDPATFRGRKGAAESFRRTHEEFDDYTMEAEEFIDAGHHIVVRVRQRGRGRVSGAEVEDQLYHVWDIRDGTAVGMRAFTEREEALEAAGLTGGVEQPERS